MKSDLVEFFTDEHSVVREIWGRSETVLFIFAGASAEFALNKAVDWLYFTGKLPSDPLARLFSTVQYARRIVFSSKAEAHQAIDNMRLIHNAVEQSRGSAIPAWAYRDVLFMLIHYSIVAYELLGHSLNDDGKEEVYNVFYRVGERMGLQELPSTYKAWLPVREAHLIRDLQYTGYTADLFSQYKKHLGALRFRVLTGAQALLAPVTVRELLQLKDASLLSYAIPLYKMCRLVKMDKPIKSLLVPAAYRNQIQEMDVSDC